jgi:hypothetical protein
MAQYDFGIIDPYVVDGVALATMLNNWRDATYTLQRGAIRPSFAVPGQLWCSDAGGATDWVVNIYVSPSVGDKPLWRLNTTTGKILIASGVDFTAAPKWPTPPDATDDTTGATTEFVKNMIASNGAVIQYKSIQSALASQGIGLGYSPTMLVTEGMEVAHINYTPRALGTRLKVECSFPSLGSQNNNSLLALFVDALNIGQAYSQWTNLAYHAHPALVRMPYISTGVTPVVISCRMAGGFNYTAGAVLDVTEYAA